MRSAVDKLYWVRISFGILAGLLAEEFTVLFHVDYTTGITVGLLFYLASFYLARYVWFRKAAREDIAKIYTTGIGGYVMVFLFVWILLFTLNL